MAEAFKKSQLVWALWHVMARRDDPVPAAFAHRINKMGTLGVPLPLSERPGKPGEDIQYTEANAFELLVALLLQDVGLKQAEVAFFVSNCRRLIEECFDRIKFSSEPMPVYMQFRFVELAEVITLEYGNLPSDFNFDYSPEFWLGKGPAPQFYPPCFIYGRDELLEQIDLMHLHIQEAPWIIVELSNGARQLGELLQQAPVTRRGRP